LSLDANTVRDVVLTLVPLILSLSVHEFAHAWVAHRLGDDTAAQQGRLTLNPVAHIDLIGTILVPLFNTLSGGFGMFGWAKPVPVSPFRFRRGVTMRTGYILTALAGPGSNVAFAIAISGVFFALSSLGALSSATGQIAFEIVQRLFIINIALAVFNIIPLYPLDGSSLLSERIREKMAANSWLCLIGLLLLINTPPAQRLMGALVSLIASAILGFWGLFF
jgi:Zn-dependent protease